MAENTLKATNQSFEMVLGEAETTRSRWWASYRDQDANGNFLAPVTVNGQSNGTAAVTIFFGPSAGVRTLVQFVWTNQDGGNHNFYFRLNNNGTVYQEQGPMLTVPSQSQQWETKRGWYPFPSNSAVTTVGPGNFYGGPIPGGPGGGAGGGAGFGPGGPSVTPNGTPGGNPATPSFRPLKQSDLPFGQLNQGQIMQVNEQGLLVGVSRLFCGRWS